MSKEPAYNLKVVMRETGIKADTLRAWERRYGLPHPERTAGGHRLYSTYDIEMIKWLMARQGDGMRIHQAVNLWNSLEQSGTDPLASALQTSSSLGRATARFDRLSGSTLDVIRQEWISACMAFDEASAESIISQAFARYPLETVCLEVLRKGISEIGTLWYRGESTVQQEHFASALAIRRINTLISAAPPASRHGRILVGCPAGEDHTFSPLLITLFLRFRGWDVIYLGANVPSNRWTATIQRSNPNLIVLSAQQLTSAASLFEMAVQARELNIPVAYGGLIFNTIPALRKRIPGYFIGESLDDAALNSEQLLTTPQVLQDIAPVGERYHLALKLYIEKLQLIESHIWENTQTNGLKEHYLSHANNFLAQDITAALRLGDLNFIQPDLHWISKLLENFEMHPDLLTKYLEIYRQGVAAHLDEGAQPITAWLDMVIENGL
jgi:methanogenic corrinoid protein MtbC1